jgi:hypothetical protein
MCAQQQISVLRCVSKCIIRETGVAECYATVDRRAHFAEEARERLLPPYIAPLIGRVWGRRSQCHRLQSAAAGLPTPVTRADVASCNYFNAISCPPLCSIAMTRFWLTGAMRFTVSFHKRCHYDIGRVLS